MDFGGCEKNLSDQNNVAPCATPSSLIHPSGLNCPTHRLLAAAHAHLCAVLEMQQVLKQHLSLTVLSLKVDELPQEFNSFLINQPMATLVLLHVISIKVGEPITDVKRGRTYSWTFPIFPPERRGRARAILRGTRPVREHCRYRKTVCCVDD